MIGVVGEIAHARGALLRHLEAGDEIVERRLAGRRQAAAVGRHREAIEQDLIGPARAIVARGITRRGGVGGGGIDRHRGDGKDLAVVGGHARTRERQRHRNAKKNAAPHPHAGRRARPLRRHTTESAGAR